MDGFSVSRIGFGFRLRDLGLWDLGLWDLGKIGVLSSVCVGSLWYN